MRQYIQTCVEIEKTVAAIYLKLSESAHLDIDVRRMFLSLANDENDHAMQLDFALRFPSGTITLEQNIPHEHAIELLSNAQGDLKKVTAQALAIAQAIELAINLEENFCRIHLNNSVKFKEESLKKMFLALARDEETHKRQLFEFRAALEDKS